MNKLVLKKNSRQLSPEELKAKVFVKLKEEGTFDGFRALLRNELVRQLHLEQPDSVHRGNDEAALSLKFPLEATNWLLMEHLKRNGYDYTLSVFALESSTPTNRQIFTMGDILNFLRISPTSQNGKNILHAYKNDKFFLWTLLSNANSSKLPSGTDTVGNQTDADPEMAEFKRVKNTLQKVDDAYDLKKRNIYDRGLSDLENVLLGPILKSDVGPRTQLANDIDLEAFCENKFREYRGEVDRLRRVLEEQHCLKLQQLIDHERNTQQTIDKQKNSVESEFYGHRQQMLTDMTKLQQREDEWESKKRFHEKMMQLESERMDSFKQALQSREESLAKLERAHEQLLKENKQHIEMSIRKQYDERQTDLNTRETELKRLQDSLDAKKILLKDNEKRFEAAFAETNQLKIDFSRATEKIKALQVENESLQNHAKSTDENLLLKAELHQLKLANKALVARNETEQSHHNDVVRELLDRLEKPSPQAQVLRKELEKLRKLHQNKCEEWCRQKISLENAIYDARCNQRAYVNRINIQSRQISSLHQAVDDLENGILSKASDYDVTTKHVSFKPLRLSGTARKESPLNAWHDTTAIDFHGTYFDTSLNPSHLPPELELGVSGLLTDSYDLDFPDYTNLNLDFQYTPAKPLNATLARIDHLKKEAERLERNFTSMRSNANHSDIPRPKDFPTAPETGTKFDVGTAAHGYRPYFGGQLVPSSTPNEASRRDGDVDVSPIPKLSNKIAVAESNLCGTSSFLKKIDQTLSPEQPASLTNRRLSFESVESEEKEGEYEKTLSKNALTDSKIAEVANELEKFASSFAAGELGSAYEEQANWKPAAINLDSAWKTTENEAGFALTGIPASETDNQERTAVDFGRSGQDEDKKVDEMSVKFGKYPLAGQEKKPVLATGDVPVFDADVAEIEGQIAWEKSSVKSQDDEFEW